MPERRQFLAALSLLPLDPSDAEAAGETIYIPSRHLETDRAFLAGFMEEYSFAMVATAKGGIRLTNVPTVFTPSAANDGWGKIWFHLANNNHQNEALDGNSETLIVFHGPHGYISPNWYANAASVNAVPTWNFAVVHVTGNTQRLDDDGLFVRNLSKLVAKNEGKYGGGGPWDFGKMPDAYLKGMRQGVTQYEMTIEKVEAKFKLGQERSPADQESMLKGMTAAAKQERGLPELSRAYFRLTAARGK